MNNMESNDNHFMDADDDWATAPPNNDVEQQMLAEYAIALSHWQVELYRGRNQRQSDAIQRYFNSTPVRNTFARMMFLANRDDKLHYTKSEIARQLHITRQAASVMVDDCLAEGWVEVVCEQPHQCFKASDILAYKMMDYVKFHLETLEKNPLTELYLSLRSWQRAQAIKASSDFTP